MKRLAVCTLLLLALGALPQTLVASEHSEAVDRILATASEKSEVMDHLDFLVNRIGPRLTSSDELQHACEWARDRFASFGIDNAHLEEWGTFPVGFNRGPASGWMITPEAKALHFGTNSWTAGTQGRQRGPALMAPEDETKIDEMGPSVHGAWILGRVNRDLREKLIALGVAGFVTPTRNDLIVTSGNYRIDWDDLPTTPIINMVPDDYNAITALLGEGKPVELEFDIRNYFVKGPVHLYNVIADTPATENPEEYVIVGGHIDSWDGATGTTDNGTGCATTLEAARILMASDVKPKRTIRFMLWSGEEQGLLGSRAYVEAHPELMDKISAVLVHDGGTNYLSGINSTEAMLPDLEGVFAPVVSLDPEYPFEVRKVDGLRGGGSDHASFLGKGVPGFFWNQAGSANYTHTHHTQWDTYDSAIPEYQRHSSTVIALGAYGIANLDHLLSREKMIVPRAQGNRFRGRIMGVNLDELTVDEVMEGTLAEKNKMMAGDVIIKVDGKPIKDREALRDAIRAGEPKKTITVRRGNKEIDLIFDWSDQERGRNAGGQGGGR